MFISRFNSRVFFSPRVPFSYSLEWKHFHSLQFIVTSIVSSFCITASFSMVLVQAYDKENMWNRDFPNLHARQTNNWFDKLCSSTDKVVKQSGKRLLVWRIQEFWKIDYSKNRNFTDILQTSFNLFSLSFYIFPLSWYTLSR